MELSSSNTKKCSYFLKRKRVLYFRKWNPALCSPSSKEKKSTPRKFLILQGTKTPEKLYSLRRKLFLYFGNGKS